MTRIAFDIGGVISKHPDIFRDFARTLMAGGATVYVITDMQDVAMIVETLKLNGFDFIPIENIRSADYAKHGEGCKAVLLRFQQRHAACFVIGQLRDLLAEHDMRIAAKRKARL